MYDYKAEVKAFKYRVELIDMKICISDGWRFPLCTFYHPVDLSKQLSFVQRVCLARFGSCYNLDCSSRILALSFLGVVCGPQLTS